MLVPSPREGTHLQVLVNVQQLHVGQLSARMPPPQLTAGHLPPGSCVRSVDVRVCVCEMCECVCMCICVCVCTFHLGVVLVCMYVCVCASL